MTRAIRETHTNFLRWRTNYFRTAYRGVESARALQSEMSSTVSRSVCKHAIYLHLRIAVRRVGCILRIHSRIAEQVDFRSIRLSSSPSKGTFEIYTAQLKSETDGNSKEFTMQSPSITKSEHDANKVFTWASFNTYCCARPMQKLFLSYFKYAKFIADEQSAPFFSSLPLRRPTDAFLEEEAFDFSSRRRRIISGTRFSARLILRAGLKSEVIFQPYRFMQANRIRLIFII